ncbi:MAG TPA: hypothetical protein VN722_13335 [Hanamia sp.]|nr:hypothetical protein [Hanamia sp.]
MKFLPLKSMLLISILFCFVCQSTVAQKNKLIKEALSKVLFKGSYFSFYLSPYISQKPKCVKQSGRYALNASESSGLEAGGNYFINFNENYSLIVGAHAGYSGRNFKLFISKSDFDPNLKDDINFQGRMTKDYSLYLSAPVWFEKRWLKKNNTSWNLDAGINLRFDPDEAYYIYDYGEVDINGQSVPVLDMEGPVGNDLKPWLNYNIGGGYSVFLSNYNFIRINLIANFSATKIVNFNYSIAVDDKPQSTGTYRTNLSYAGLSISYILTGANKRVLREYQELSRNKIK